MSDASLWKRAADALGDVLPRWNGSTIQQCGEALYEFAKAAHAMAAHEATKERVVMQEEQTGEIGSRFHVGAKVRLRTGNGPVMVVTASSRCNADRVYVMWFDATDRLCEYFIPTDALREA
jgi:hypothetical protein